MSAAAVVVGGRVLEAAILALYRPITVAGAGAWWSALEGEGAPKIIARLPFVERADHPASLPLFVVSKPLSTDAAVERSRDLERAVAGWSAAAARAIAAFARSARARADALRRRRASRFVAARRRSRRSPTRWSRPAVRCAASALVGGHATPLYRLARQELAAYTDQDRILRMTTVRASSVRVPACSISAPMCPAAAKRPGRRRCTSFPPTKRRSGRARRRSKRFARRAKRSAHYPEGAVADLARRRSARRSGSIPRASYAARARTRC